MAKMQKMFLPCEVKSFDDKGLIIEHFITTDSEDRSGDEVDPDGMVLNGTPSVLKQHGMDADIGSEPIARCLSLTPAKNDRGAKGIRARTQYYDGSHLTPPDNTGRRLYEKAKGNFMPYWSIGFIPYASEPKQGGGRRIKRWECVEYSQVGVPDNAEAKGFSPSDPAAVLLEGTIEHRKVDGIDIDARYTDAYVKDFEPIDGTVWVTLDHSRVFAEPAGGFERRLQKAGGECNGKSYDVVYAKDANGQWYRYAFDYGKDWTEEEAKAHVAEGKFYPCTSHEYPHTGSVSVTTDMDAKARERAVTILADAARQFTKSFTDTLQFNSAYVALSGAMDALLGEVLHRAERPKDKEVRGLVKEFAAFVETNLTTILTSLANMEAEQATKAITSLMERKSTAPADPALGAAESTAASEQPPPAVTTTATSAQTPVVESSTEGEEAEVEGLVFELDGTPAGNSSPSDAESDGVLDLDPEEVKSLIRDTCATHVRGTLNKLRGRLES